MLQSQEEEKRNGEANQFSSFVFKQIVKDHKISISSINSARNQLCVSSIQKHHISITEKSQDPHSISLAIKSLEERIRIEEEEEKQGSGRSEMKSIVPIFVGASKSVSFALFCISLLLISYLMRLELWESNNEFLKCERERESNAVRNSKHDDIQYESHVWCWRTRCFTSMDARWKHDDVNLKRKNLNPPMRGYIIDSKIAMMSNLEDASDFWNSNPFRRKEDNNERSRHSSRVCAVGLFSSLKLLNVSYEGSSWT